MSTDKNGELLLPNGGYRRLKSFRLARLVYDITVHFVNLYIPPDSRTCDQMVQAARSGVQNIAEGSVDGATSAKLELNLYNVALAGGVDTHTSRAVSQYGGRNAKARNGWRSTSSTSYEVGLTTYYGTSAEEVVGTTNQ